MPFFEDSSCGTWPLLLAVVVPTQPAVYLDAWRDDGDGHGYTVPLTCQFGSDKSGRRHCEQGCCIYPGHGTAAEQDVVVSARSDAVIEITCI